jgi:glycosyltransferase involved in cell wall biosynthesis
MSKLRVAIVHDYIKEYGGAERVLEAFHELYPDATVFTSVYLPKFLGPHRARFKDWKIKTSWLQHMPFNNKLISPFRLVSAQAFRQFDFSEFDLIIVSATGAYFPNTLDKKNALQICYCHTPPRYLYGYATAREWKKNKIFAILAPIANHFLRMTDFNASKNVDYYVANSQEVAGRIRKFYRRDATVIYPPVSLQGAGNREQGIEKTYFLTGGRLARAKHVDIIVEACTQAGVPLKVFGKSFAGYGEELQEKAGKTVEFLGEVSDEEKKKLMAGAKAFLFASIDEDFGIVPVEAMGAGVPVIAYKSGGVKETVIEGKTGIFFPELTSSSLQMAMRKFEKMKFDPKVCRKQAEKFSKERFVKEIKIFISSKILHA